MVGPGNSQPNRAIQQKKPFSSPVAFSTNIYKDYQVWMTDDTHSFSKCTTTAKRRYCRKSKNQVSMVALVWCGKPSPWVMCL